MFNLIAGFLITAVALVGGFFGGKAINEPQLGLSTFTTSQGGTGTSSPSGILYGDNGVTGSLKTVNIGSNLTFSGGTLSATGGSGSGGGTWSTTTSQVSGQFINYPNNTTDVVVIGSNASTSAEWWYDPNIGRGYFQGSFGIGTTTPSANLSVQGNGLLSGNLTAANITATGTLSVGGNATTTGTHNVGVLRLSDNSNIATIGTGLTLSGTDLQTTLGTSVDLSAEVTGTLPVANGGTASTSPSMFLFGPNDGTLISTSTIAQNFIDGNIARDSELHDAVTLAGENYLSISGQQITAGAIALGGTNVSGTLLATNGGTGIATYTKGDIIYSSAANTLAALGIGSSGQVLMVSNGIPVWAATTSAVTSVSNADGSLTISPTTGAVVASLNVGNANTWTAQQTINAALLVNNATSTITNLVMVNATSTNATTTSLGVLNLTAANCDVKSTTDGVIYCGTDATGAGGGAYAWTPTAHFGTTTSATGTPVWLKNGVYASTTAEFMNATSTGIFTVAGANSTSTLAVGKDGSKGGCAEFYDVNSAVWVASYIEGGVPYFDNTRRCAD